MKKTYIGLLIVFIVFIFYVVNTAFGASQIVKGTLLYIASDASIIGVGLEDRSLLIKPSPNAKILRGQVGKDMRKVELREFALGDTVIAVVDDNGSASSLKALFGIVKGTFSKLQSNALMLVTVTLIAGCGKSEVSAPLGSKENPIKMALVPSLDTNKLIASGEILADLLEKETGLAFRIDVPTSYTAVISAMGAGTVDVGWLSPLPYILAHDKYGVKVILTSVRDNSTDYWSFIIARKDTGINKLSDLKGKKFAYGDPLSTSGAIYAKHLIRTSGYDPEGFFSNVIYAGAHDKVVMAVYNKQVDGGAIYGGVVSDAREKVASTIKDVMKNTHVVAKSITIPNDTVSVRKGLPEDMVKKIKDGLLKIAKSDEGQKSIMDVYGIDGFVPAKDSDYDSVREVAKAEDIKLEKMNK